MQKSRFIQRFTDIDWSHHIPIVHGMDRLGKTAIGTSTVRGNSFHVFSDTQEMLKNIAHDVDRAQISVLIEFYIWNEGGAADEVLEALIRAATSQHSEQFWGTARPASAP